jgi:hypothetical protein
MRVRLARYAARLIVSASTRRRRTSAATLAADNRIDGVNGVTLREDQGAILIFDRSAACLNPVERSLINPSEGAHGEECAQERILRQTSSVNID